MRSPSTPTGGREPAGERLTFFVGSLFFTTAALLQLLVSVGAVSATGHHPLAAVQWRALRQAPHRAEWWAGIVQFAGTILFNISTFDALQQALDATEANRRVWTPDMLTISTRPRGQRPRVRGCAATDGSRGDRGTSAGRSPSSTWSDRWPGIGVSAPYVMPSTGDFHDLQRVNVGTFVGALGFLVGAILLIPAQSVADPSTAPSSA